MLLDVDPGKATNRTVVTLAGTPEAVIEGAFRAIKKASQVIDMVCMNTRCCHGYSAHTRVNIHVWGLPMSVHSFR